MDRYIEILLYIAKKSGLFQELQTSTIEISKQLKKSQQTISRLLKGMEDNSLIKRTARPSGITIQLDDKGREILQQQYNELSKIFGKIRSEHTATIESGYGEGAYYVSQNNYQKQFKQKLGFVAYPGTLNLKINKQELLSLISNKEKIIIESFKTIQRTFGSLICYKIEINNTKAAIVIPERTKHDKDIIEIISEFHLRKRLNLKDNDKVTLK